VGADPTTVSPALCHPPSLPFRRCALPPRLPPARHRNANATVKGSGSYSSAVTWSASGGTINSSGLLTAPASASNVTVTATSTQDTTKSVPSIRQSTWHWSRHRSGQLLPPGDPAGTKGRPFLLRKHLCSVAGALLRSTEPNARCCPRPDQTEYGPIIGPGP
jgi:hypothetical protein